MSVIIPPGFANVKVMWRQGSTGLILSNTFGADVSAPPDQTTVDLLSASLATTYKAQLFTISAYVGIHVEVGSDGSPLVYDSTSGAIAGTRTALAPAAPQVQLLADKRTNLGGRQHRGRAFLSDAEETEITDAGVVTAPCLTRLTSWCNNVMSNLAVGPFAGMVLLHSPPQVWTLVGGLPRRVPSGQPAPAPTVVSSFTPDPKCSTLRQRFPR